MAIDTRDKRSSCLGIDGSFRYVLPNPDGTINQPDRQHIAYVYRAISAGAVSAAVRAMLQYRMRRTT
jgi:hypothetical protein